MAFQLRGVARLFPSPAHLGLLGFAIPQIWIYVVVQSVAILGTSASLVFHGASGSTLLIAAALFRILPRVKTPSWATALSGLAMAVLPFYLAVFPATDPICSALLIVGGIGCAWCFLVWFAVCCASGPRDSICYLLVSFALAAAFRIVLAFLPHTAALWTLVLLSLGMVALHRLAINVVSSAAGGQGNVDGTEVALAAVLSQTKPGREGSADSRQNSPARATASNRQHLFIVLELALYSFALGTVNDASSEYQALTLALVLNYSFRIVLMLVLLAWFLATDGHKGVARLAQTAFCCIAVVVLGIACLGDGASIVVASLISFARGIVLMLMALVCAEMSCSKGVHPFVAFGIGRGVYEFSVLGGSVFSTYVLQGLFSVSITLNIVFFIVGCVFLFVTSRAAKTVREIDGGNGDRADEEAGPSHSARTARLDVEDKCRATGREHGLTDRETEVLILMCSGRSKAYVADHLAVSENTVRHHCKHIYTKLGVHSREELFDLIGIG